MRKQRASTGNVRPSSFLAEVVIRHPQHDCVLSTWDTSRTCLYVTGIYSAEVGLPADLGVMTLEHQVDVPVLVLTSYRISPETHVDVRVLGALHIAQKEQEITFAVDSWFLVAVVALDPTLEEYSALETLPAPLSMALKTYVLTQTLKKEQSFRKEQDGIQQCGADEAAHLVRETRLQIKRAQRKPHRGKTWFTPQEEVSTPTWCLIEGLANATRAHLQQNRLEDGEERIPHAQAEHLIRFVPMRFQKALAELLLDDERILAFLERPLLRHRIGMLKIQQWRSNAGLFLVTDRQVLWLRDFFSPGQDFLPGGYIARTAPVERLQHIMLIPMGTAPEHLASRLPTRESPYLRLVIEVESSTGSELLVIEFPQQVTFEQPLMRIIDRLRTFLPALEGQTDRRVRRLPVVDIWQPQGAEAERLKGLGGSVPSETEHLLKHRLVDELHGIGDEVLVSVLVPALEDYQSPARLVALTRQALLVLEETPAARRPVAKRERAIRRYGLCTLSSAQLRTSLLGSSLSLFIPQGKGKTHQLVLPFHSPAIAWFCPLFTRLRVALSDPLSQPPKKS